MAIIFSCLGLVSRGLTHGYLNDTDPTPAAILIGLTMIVGHLVFLCAVPVALFTVRRRPMLLVIVMSAFMGYGAGSAILRLA